jgi:hypothetical protein
MSSMLEIYQQVLQGKKFKSISDLNLGVLSIKHPSELCANSPVMQAIIAKHWDAVKRPVNNKTR